MQELPTHLTYFISLSGISKILANSSLPMFELDQLNDPFLPDKNGSLKLDIQQFFDSSVKAISHGILGKSPPRGQPNHSLQKAIMRWRAEERFNNVDEIKVALQGLLPAMVELEFNKIKKLHAEWIDFANDSLLLPFFERYQDLVLWEKYGNNHSGLAIRFKCEEDSFFEHCQPVIYSKSPAKTIDVKAHIEFMMGGVNEVEFSPKDILLHQDYNQRLYKEWRLIRCHDEDNENYLSFPIRLIKSIYIGALVSDTNAEQLKKHIVKMYPKIKLYRAYPNDSDYSLKFIDYV
jgi:hypothetical protein